MKNKQVDLQSGSYYLFVTVNVTMEILLGLSLLEKQRRTKVKTT